ncbi:hypothetical protein EG240_01210 [Paenimyroides tangerinum]|uniref:Pyrrolo-quinoline quinone repeat domain-containing protein n=1 Tax=Paenimyroides tangerinum TaxID=2488728 RepID=A0A3P3WD82_9FLAO|nr:PQQ-binding-like beta-propeller repeat protein [Paenimyroides tangerinum]RRJ93121.1 hypothetical protein EG240_01210 [Paenimyroides tangerinum]
MKNYAYVIGLTALSSVFSTAAFSQNVVSFTNEIQEVKVEPLTGNIFVKTKDVLSSVNSQSNAIEWSISIDKINNQNSIAKMSKIYSSLSNNDFSNAFKSDSEISFISNSPFAQVKFDNNNVLINSTNGEVLFNSADLGYVIYSSSFIPSNNELLILGQKDNKVVFVNYDLIGKKIKWESEVGDVDGLGKSLGNYFKSLVKNDVSVSENKIIIGKNVIYAGVKNLLFALDQNNGTVKWKTDYPVNNFFISGNGDKMITILNSGGLLSSKQKLNMLDAFTGEKVWKDDITTAYISYLEDHGDKVLIAHQKGFNFYDYATGEKLWKKDPKGSDIKRVIPIDGDYLYIADNEMNLIDKEGKSKWKKFVEIADDSEDQVYYLGKVGNDRVFYLTDTYGNMVEYATGKKIWKKNVEFDKKRPLTYDFKDDKFLVYNNKRIYTFNSNNEDSPKPKGKIDVENDKTIQTLESFDWGVCIVGQNDVIGLDNDGNVIYQKTYSEPGEAARRLMKTGGIIASSYFGFKGSAQKAIANTQITYVDSNGNEISQDLFSESAKNKKTQKGNQNEDFSDMIDKNLLASVNSRFNGLKQSNNYAVVLAKGSNGPELVKVRKKDGVEVVKISLDSNKPIYEIDGVTDNIYFASGKDLKMYK